ncbi:MAG: hypothetical protein UD936_09025 [Acutalibacteraceae bacterium]|nr:hypothetical protein [Acutalibacteraceae bacterium]
MQIIKDVYFENHCQFFSEKEIMNVENSLNIKLPESLRGFYLMFGNDLDLLKSMYNIALPEELYVQDNILILAKENQNICGYGINILNQKPVYFDCSNNILKEMNEDLEDFLIYLLAVQGTEFLDCIGSLDISVVSEIERYLIRITGAEGKAVFCDRCGIICVDVGNSILICAKNDDYMESFEDATGLEVDYL